MNLKCAEFFSRSLSAVCWHFYK